MTKKKFAKLELFHLHLQRNVEIPETHLLIHPTIQRVVSEALATDTRLTDDGNTRREAPIRETSSKRKGDKRLKDEKG